MTRGTGRAWPLWLEERRPPTLDDRLPQFKNPLI
jgi:hypothetical protein